MPRNRGPRSRQQRRGGPSGPAAVESSWDMLCDVLALKTCAPSNEDARSDTTLSPSSSMEDLTAVPSAASASAAPSEASAAVFSTRSLRMATATSTVAESPMAAAAALGAPGFSVDVQSWEPDRGVRSSALSNTGLSTQCWGGRAATVSTRQLPSWWAAGAEAAYPPRGQGFPSGQMWYEQNGSAAAGISFSQPSSFSMVPSFMCGTTGAEDECRFTVETRLSNTVAHLEEGLTQENASSTEEVSGYSVLQEIAQPGVKKLGLCFHVCPDEPSDEDEDKVMDKWRAECRMPKWSAMSPLSVAEDGCIGGVIKNTFVHIGPPPAELQQHGAQRRSRSLPKDMGSAKSIWDATRQAFKFAASVPACCTSLESTCTATSLGSTVTSLETTITSWADISVACDNDPQESTTAPESEAGFDEAITEGCDDECNSWWDRASWQRSERWQGRSTNWHSPARTPCKSSWKTEGPWQDWRRDSWSGGRHSDRPGSNSWQNWKGKGTTAEDTSGSSWSHWDRKSSW